MKLAPTGDGVGVGTVGLLDPERHVALQLPKETVPQLAAGDVLSVAAGEGAIVDDEVHRDGGLLDRDSLHPFGMIHRGEGLADLDGLESGERDDVACFGLLYL